MPNCIFLKNLKQCVPDGMLIALDPEGDEGNHDADKGASPWIDLTSHNYCGGIALDNRLYSESRLDAMRVEAKRRYNEWVRNRQKLPSIYGVPIWLAEGIQSRKWQNSSLKGLLESEPSDHVVVQMLHCNDRMTDQHVVEHGIGCSSSGALPGTSQMQENISWYDPNCLE